MPKDSVGQKFMTKQGDEIEVVCYQDPKHITIRFKEGHTLVVRMHDIKRGFIMNPLHPMTYGVGYLGVGKYKTKINKKFTPYYKLWNKVMERCYSFNFHKRNPTYKDCSVDERWHNFQVFAEWFENNYIEGFELDKDLILKNNKIYSIETCCFLPKVLNQIFVSKPKSKKGLPRGVTEVKNRYSSYYRKHLGSFDTPEEAFEAYKIAKEKRIKDLADKWKPFIKEVAYEAMYIWKIEITD